MRQPSPQSSRLKRMLSVLAWVLIGLLLGATLWAVRWAAKQPKPHSIWGEPSDKPLTRKLEWTHIGDFLHYRISSFKENNDSNWN